MAGGYPCCCPGDASASSSGGGDFVPTACCGYFPTCIEVHVPWPDDSTLRVADLLGGTPCCDDFNAIYELEVLGPGDLANYCADGTDPWLVVYPFLTTYTDTVAWGIDLSGSPICTDFVKAALRYYCKPHATLAGEYDAVLIFDFMDNTCDQSNWFSWSTIFSSYSPSPPMDNPCDLSSGTVTMLKDANQSGSPGGYSCWNDAVVIMARQCTGDPGGGTTCCGSDVPTILSSTCDISLTGLAGCGFSGYVPSDPLTATLTYAGTGVLGPLSCGSTTFSAGAMKWYLVNDRGSGRVEHLVLTMLCTATHIAVTMYWIACDTTHFKFVTWEGTAPLGSCDLTGTVLSLDDDGGCADPASTVTLDSFTM